MAYSSPVSSTQLSSYRLPLASNQLVPSSTSADCRRRSSVL